MKQSDTQLNNSIDYLTLYHDQILFLLQAVGALMAGFIGWNKLKAQSVYYKLIRKTDKSERNIMMNPIVLTDEILTLLPVLIGAFEGASQAHKDGQSLVGVIHAGILGAASKIGINSV